MTHKHNFDFFKEMYFLELENKEKINSRIAVPLSIITLLAGAVLYLLSAIKDIEGIAWLATFFSFFSLFLVSFILSIFYIAKAYYNYSYKYIPSLAKLHQDSLRLEAYVDHQITYQTSRGQQPSVDKDTMLRDEIQKDLYNHFLQATDINTGLNEKKLFYLRRVGIWLLLSIIFGSICLIPATFGKKDDVQKVEVIKQVETKEEVKK